MKEIEQGSAVCFMVGTGSQLPGLPYQQHEVVCGLRALD